MVLDFEMTGCLKSPGVVLLEGAAIGIDKGPERVGPIVIHATEDEPFRIGDFVRDMHTAV
ncbi:MAG: hypothetical protein EOP24_43095 [Hyphomicrobiales bacterium]|nr:MAG: hypothetical protein EOP24_43095 [Hyphomicrobiales bacterium]